MLVRVIESDCVDGWLNCCDWDFGQIHSDISYRFNGKWYFSSKIRRTIQADNQQTQPTGKEGSFSIYRALIFQSERRRLKIIEKLDEGPWSVCKRLETALDGITGLTKKKKKWFEKSFRKTRTRSWCLNWQILAFTTAIAQKVIGMYKDKARAVLDEDHMLLQRIEGLGRQMDSIA